MSDTPWPESFAHISVLLHPTVDALVTDPNGLYIDATFGRGWHTRELLSRLSPRARVIGFDRDPQAVAAGQALALADPRFSIVHAPFSQMWAWAQTQQMSPNSVTGIMADLGVSSPQLDDAARGMSFMREGSLDMRMDPSTGEPVRDWLARASEPEIAQVLHDYGDERHAKRIAKALVEYQTTSSGERAQIQTTLELASLIAKYVPRDKSGHHPATRSFQAFRIFINDELGELERTLTHSLDLLAFEGRFAVISFHSLEDRRVKQFIAQHSRTAQIDRRSPAFALQDMTQSTLRLQDLGRVLPSTDECKTNARARSAVLRVASRTAFGLNGAAA